jgi:hypothetical protein
VLREAREGERKWLEAVCCELNNMHPSNFSTAHLLIEPTPHLRSHTAKKILSTSNGCDSFAQLKFLLLRQVRWIPPVGQNPVDKV